MSPKQLNPCRPFWVKVIVTALFLLFSLGLQENFSLLLGESATLTKTIQFTSTPQGVNIFSLEAGRIKQYGITPVSLDISFRSENSSKRFHFKKIGYRSKKLIVEASDSTVNVQMEKESILMSPEQVWDSRYIAAQKKVNSILNQYIYQASSDLTGETFEIMGQIGLLNLDEKPYLGVIILLDDDFRKNNLASIRRIRNEEQRYTRLAEEALKKGAGKLLVELIRQLKTVGDLSGILLSVNYSKTRSVLIDETVSYRANIVQSGQYSTTIYEWTQPVTFTNVETTKDLYTIYYEVPSSEFSVLTNSDGSYSQLKGKCVIFTNDNYKKKFVTIDPVKAPI